MLPTDLGEFILYWYQKWFSQVQEAIAKAKNAPTEEPMELDMETTEQNKSEVPDADELCRQVDEVLDQTQNQPSTSASATAQVTNLEAVMTTSESVVHTPPPIFRPYL